ncbi:hypothetical protein MGG_16241 [Pyricularia oryzae 70-15]|uniref:Uncharacterized protein n=3 Tax=Pyricularia oryzae TaxID=318829 RepID=G4MPE6_PYRO7|nr:uncharacterized protein MGG_16241 [Pyricularia oryzae 70-15]EHA57199.1 hypothetical protein MGG_16241 [Pyricularia oryzae 70-15]ELQ41400.1 hypothetical protein OOU_Y34scaffold00283g94 [Pyricularia oryzae Y34]
MNQGKPCSSFRGQQDCTPPDRAPVPTLAFLLSLILQNGGAVLYFEMLRKFR